MKLPAEVTVVEQITGEDFAAKPHFIPTETKVWLIRELINAGYKQCQVGNFGNPKFMPQFRNCEEVYRQKRNCQLNRYYKNSLHSQTVCDLQKDSL